MSGFSSSPLPGKEPAPEMYVRELGPSGAPPVVLVHGFVVSGEYFRPTWERLAHRFSILVPDLPGFGRSPPASAPPTVPDLASALLQWLCRLVPSGAALVANSFGCQIAVEMAMRRPDLVDRLVLVSPAIDPVNRRPRHLLPALVRESRTQSAALRRQIAADYARAGPAIAASTLRHALWDRMEDKLPFVEARSLVVWGSNDTLVSRGWAETATALLPKGRLMVIEGAPHAMNFDAPDLLTAAIRPFLEGEGD